MKKLFLAIMLCSTALMAQSNPDRFGGGGPLITSGSLSTGDRTCIRLGAGEATVGYTLIGISSATVTFAGSTKRPLDATSLKAISTATADGVYRVDVAGYSYVCAVLTAGATQSILVVWETSTATQAPSASGGGSSSVTVNNDGGTPVPTSRPTWKLLWDSGLTTVVTTSPDLSVDGMCEVIVVAEGGLGGSSGTMALNGKSNGGDGGTPVYYALATTSPSGGQNGRPVFSCTCGAGCAVSGSTGGNIPLAPVIQMVTPTPGGGNPRFTVIGR